MHYAKYLAPELEAYTDEDTGLTYNPDGSITDVMGAIHYPTDDLYGAYVETFDTLLDPAVLDRKL